MFDTRAQKKTKKQKKQKQKPNKQPKLTGYGRTFEAFAKISVNRPQ